MVEDRGEANHPKEACSPKVPTLLPVQRNVLFSSCSFLLLKNARPQGKRIMGRESGVFIRRSVFILPYDLKLSFYEKISRASLSLLPLFLSKLFPNLCSGSASTAWSAALTLNYA